MSTSLTLRRMARALVMALFVLLTATLVAATFQVVAPERALAQTDDDGDDDDGDDGDDGDDDDGRDDRDDDDGRDDRDDDDDQGAPAVAPAATPPAPGDDDDDDDVQAPVGGVPTGAGGTTRSGLDGDAMAAIAALGAGGIALVAALLRRARA